MTLAADLKTAKALIDTPEKLALVGSVQQACTLTVGSLTGGDAFLAILDQPGDPEAVAGAGSYVTVSFESIMNRIDRAIAAAEATP